MRYPSCHARPHGLRNLSALAAVLALLCAGAQAQQRFAASAGNLQYTLTDLAPGDGIAPAVTFAGPAQIHLLGNLFVFRNGQSVQDWSGERLSTGPAVLIQDWAEGAHLAAGFDSQRLVVAASLDPAIDGLHAYVQAQSQQAFTLSPYTRITFTVDGAADLAMANDPSKLGSATAWAGLLVDHSGIGSIPDPGTPGMQELGGLVFNDNWLGANFSTNLADTITFAWDNDSATQQSATVTYVAGALGSLEYVAIPSVPEPVEWAMLGLGAALLWLRHSSRYWRRALISRAPHRRRRGAGAG